MNIDNVKCYTTWVPYFYGITVFTVIDVSDSLNFKSEFYIFVENQKEKIDPEIHLAMHIKYDFKETMNPDFPEYLKKDPYEYATYDSLDFASNVVDHMLMKKVLETKEWSNTKKVDFQENPDIVIEIDRLLSTHKRQILAMQKQTNDQMFKDAIKVVIDIHDRHTR